MLSAERRQKLRTKQYWLFWCKTDIMSIASSIKVIEGIVDQYHTEVLELDIPSFITPSSSYKPTVSPYVNQFKLNRISNDIPNIKIELNKYKSHKTYQDVSDKMLQLQNLLDEKAYVNKNLINTWVLDNSIKSVNGNDDQDADLNLTNRDEAAELHEEEDNLASLRKRLLSGGTHTSLDDTSNNKSAIDKANNYHESIQEDILNELTGFAANLKQSAVNLSTKLLDDNTILNKTSDNLMKNETLMQSVGNNLNNYVTNKSGGKISFWFLMKVLLGSFVLFFLMVVIIKIFPKM